MPPRKKRGSKSRQAVKLTLVDPLSKYSYDFSDFEPEVREKEKPRVASIPPGYFMKHLRAREFGLTHNYGFRAETVRQKLCDFSRVRTQEFRNDGENLHTTLFLRAGKSALVGIWYVQIHNAFTHVAAQLPYDLSKVAVNKTSYIESKYRILDACQFHTDPDFFLCVTSDPTRTTGEVTIATPRSEDEHELMMFSYRHPGQKDFWCCNANMFTQKFALGCDEEVCLYSIMGLEERRQVKERIYSLAYNKAGTVLHMTGLNGEFLLYDVRTEKTSLSMKPDEKLLDDVLLLNDENFCIISGLSGKIMKMDLRNKKVVMNYKFHERRSKKIPISVNERFSALSCTGSDDRTRVWCLKTGELLNSFQPPSTYPARSCLVPRSSRCVIHLVQDYFLHVYSMLK